MKNINEMIKFLAHRVTSEVITISEEEIEDLSLEAAKRSREERKTQGFIEEELLPYVNSEDYFITYTTIPKVGINPGSRYNTPIGIYTYPLKEIYQDILHNTVPFADTKKTPYIYLLKVKNKSTFIKDLQTSYKKSDLKGDVKKLKQHFRNDPKALTFIDLYINEVGTAALKEKLEKLDYHHDLIYRLPTSNLLPGRMMWYLTYNLSKYFSPGNHTVTWNVILRKVLGYSGIADRSGKSIIHEGEPTQAVFLSKDAFQVVKKLDKKKAGEQKEESERRPHRPVDTLVKGKEISLEELLKSSDEFKISYISKEAPKLELPREFWTNKIIIGVLYTSPEVVVNYRSFPYDKIKELSDRAVRVITNREPIQIAKMYDKIQDERIFKELRKIVLSDPRGNIAILNLLKDYLKEDYVSSYIIVEELVQNDLGDLIDRLPKFIKELLLSSPAFIENSAGENFANLPPEIKESLLKNKQFTSKFLKYLEKDSYRLYNMGKEVYDFLKGSPIRREYIEDEPFNFFKSGADFNSEEAEILAEKFIEGRYKITVLDRAPSNSVRKLLEIQKIKEYFVNSVKEEPFQDLPSLSTIKQLPNYEEVLRDLKERLIKNYYFDTVSQDVREELAKDFNFVKNFLLKNLDRYTLNNFATEDSIKKLNNDPQFLKAGMTSPKAPEFLKAFETSGELLSDPEVKNNIISLLNEGWVPNFKEFSQKVITKIEEEESLIKKILLKDFSNHKYFSKEFNRKLNRDLPFLEKAMSNRKTFLTITPEFLNTLNRNLKEEFKEKVIETIETSNFIPQHFSRFINRDPELLEELAKRLEADIAELEEEVNKNLLINTISKASIENLKNHPRIISIIKKILSEDPYYIDYFNVGVIKAFSPHLNLKGIYDQEQLEYIKKKFKDSHPNEAFTLEDYEAYGDEEDYEF